LPSPEPDPYRWLNPYLEVIKKTLDNGEGVIISGLWKFCEEEKKKRGGGLDISCKRESDQKS